MIFQRVLSMSFSASVVILAVLLARAVLIGAPKKWSYLLWAVVGFRLCCPVSLRSAVSLFALAPSSVRLFRPVTESWALSAMPTVVGQTLAAPVRPVDVLNVQAAHGIDWFTLCSFIWLAGIAVMLLWGVVRYLRVRSALLGAVRAEDQVYETDRIASPFVLGLIHPRVYLPLGVEGERRRYVLAHEQYHIRRGDHWFKTLAYLLLSVHWFNPLCWLAFYLMNRDMELSCDEYVLSQVGNAGADYSDSLLSFAAPRQFPAPGPLAFGESDISRRVKNALRWRRPKPWVTILSLALCAVVLAACATNPAQKRDHTAGNPSASRQAVDWRSRDIAVTLGSSSRFTETDLEAAADAIMAKFDRFGEGFTMQRLSYEADGDAQELQWLNEHSSVPGAGMFTECVRFRSDFHTPSGAGSTGFNSDADYTGWNWYLAREEGGDWIVVDMGY